MSVVRFGEDHSDLYIYFSSGKTITIHLAFAPWIDESENLPPTYILGYEDAIEKIKELKEIGYCVPDYVIPDILHEIAMEESGEY